MQTVLLINNGPVSSEQKLGGGDVSLLTLASALSQHGWLPHVIVPGRGRLTRLFDEYGINYTIFPFVSMSWRTPFLTLKNIYTWRRMIKSIDPALIHANTTSVNRFFSFASSLLNIPYVTHVRLGMEPGETSWTYKYFPKPSAFIFVSKAMRDECWPEMSQYCPKSYAYVVHNAIELEKYVPGPYPGDNPYRIGIFANFAPLKRHEDFLRMASEINQQRSDVEYWIVGDDTGKSFRKQILIDLSKELNLGESVKFMGHREDIPWLLSQIHVSVLTSQFESFGRVVIESMAAGIPVVASQTGGIPEIVENQIDGILVDVGDYKAFANAAIDLIENKDKWSNISKRSIKKARSNYSSSANAKKIAHVYESVLKCQAKGA
jgi:glycosyltransferase involved in cell wall biosynthesis